MMLPCSGAACVVIAALRTRPWASFSWRVSGKFDEDRGNGAVLQGVKDGVVGVSDVDVVVIRGVVRDEGGRGVVECYVVDVNVIAVSVTVEKLVMVLMWSG